VHGPWGFCRSSWARSLKVRCAGNGVCNPDQVEARRYVGSRSVASNVIDWLSPLSRASHSDSGGPKLSDIIKMLAVMDHKNGMDVGGAVRKPLSRPPAMDTTESFRRSTHPGDSKGDLVGQFVMPQAPYLKPCRE